MLKFISNRDNIHFECEIVGYQFPEIADEWCLLRIKVIYSDQVFEKIDPALETMDLPKLHHWFSALANNTLPYSSHVWFTEPCINFSFNGYRDGLVYISIELAYELEPNFKIDSHSGYDTQDEESQYEPFIISFALAPDDFKATLEYLDQVMEQYPKRRLT